MDLESKLVLLALGGASAADVELLAAAGWSARRSAAAPPRNLGRGLRRRLRALASAVGGDARQRAHAALPFCARPDVFCLSADEPVYPPLLRQIPDAPGVLMLRGRPAAAVAPGVAVVGSRNATPAGVRLAECLGEALAEAGVPVISGLAYGIDVAAHRGVVAGGGTGVAVMGRGLESVYPAAHASVAAALLENGGAWLAELLPAVAPRRHHFPRRNRIVSGLAQAVVVVEAAPRSGSLVTARLALEQNRDVFAVPGSVWSEVSRGCHALLRDGAWLLERPDDLFDVLPELGDGRSRRGAATVIAREPHDPEAAAVLTALGFDARPFEALRTALDWPAARLRAVLTGLELDGFVRQQSGRYIRDPAQAPAASARRPGRPSVA